MLIETYVKRKDGVFSGVFCAEFVSPTDRVKALNAVKVKLLDLGAKMYGKIKIYRQKYALRSILLPDWKRFWFLRSGVSRAPASSMTSNIHPNY